MRVERRGKQFEGVIKDAFNKVDGVSIDRIHDQTTGFKGSSNICDFIVYRYPNQFYIECKTIHDNRLPFSNIPDNQWRMNEKTRIKGVSAGVICWWIDYDKTYYMPIQYLWNLRSDGKKSVSVLDVENNPKCIELKGRKKRIFFDYDLYNFLDEVISLDV